MKVYNSIIKYLEGQLKDIKNAIKQEVKAWGEKLKI